MDPITFGPFVDSCAKTSPESVGVALVYTRGSRLIEVPVGRRESEYRFHYHELYSENDFPLEDALADVAECGGFMPVVQQLASHLEKFPSETTIPQTAADWINPRLSSEGFRLTVPTCSADAVSSNVVWLIPGAAQDWLHGHYFLIANLRMDLNGKLAISKYWRSEGWAIPALYKYLGSLPPDFRWLTEAGQKELFRKHELYRARRTKSQSTKIPRQKTPWVASVISAAKGTDEEALIELLRQSPAALSESDSRKVLTALIRSDYENSAAWWVENAPHTPTKRQAAMAVRYLRYQVVAAIYRRGFLEMSQSVTADPEDLAILMGDSKMLRTMLDNTRITDASFWRPPGIDAVLVNFLDGLLPVFFEGHSPERQNRILQAVFVRAIASERPDVARRTLDIGFPLSWKYLRDNAGFDFRDLSEAQVAIVGRCMRANPPEPSQYPELFHDPNLPLPLRSILIDMSKGIPGHQSRVDAALLSVIRSACIWKGDYTELLLLLIDHGAADLTTVPETEFTNIADTLLSTRHRDVRQRRMNLFNLIGLVEDLGFPLIAKKLALIRTTPSAQAR